MLKTDTKTFDQQHHQTRRKARWALPRRCKRSGWVFDSFKLTERDGHFSGRTTST